MKDTFSKWKKDKTLYFTSNSVVNMVVEFIISNMSILFPRRQHFIDTTAECRLSKTTHRHTPDLIIGSEGDPPRHIAFHFHLALIFKLCRPTFKNAPASVPQTCPVGASPLDPTAEWMNEWNIRFAAVNQDSKISSVRSDTINTEL